MRKPKLIIIDGIDKVGKSLIVRELQRGIGYPCVKPINRSNTNGLYHIKETIALYGARPNDFYEDLVTTETILQTGATAIFDRSLISANVYRHPVALHGSIMDHWYAQLAIIGTFYIWIDANYNFVRNNGANLSQERFSGLHKRFERAWMIMPARRGYELHPTGRLLIKSLDTDSGYENLTKIKILNSYSTSPGEIAGLILQLYRQCDGD